MPGLTVSAGPRGHPVLVAHYGSGGVSSLPVRDGIAGPPACVIRHEGRGPDPDRQAAPHAHGIWRAPAGRFVLATDLGTDQVLVYALDASTAGLSPHAPPGLRTAAGAGPRHAGRR